MFKITIPKPCFEGWENMLPNEQGRHCNACVKTVVDFSVMSDEAVEQYFISNYGNSICGRFKNTQLQRIVISLPQNIFHLQLPFWKKFLAVFLICFGGSFLGIDTTMAGNAFTQGSPISHYSKKIEKTKVDKKTRRHKGKKKSKTSITRDWPIVYPAELHRAGYTTIIEPPPFVFPDSVAYNDHSDTTTTVKNNTGSGNPHKNPSSKIPSPDTAFILPDVFAARNPFSKKKKAQHL